jgi:hypothetical protein
MMPSSEVPTYRFKSEPSFCTVVFQYLVIMKISDLIQNLSALLESQGDGDVLFVDPKQRIQLAYKVDEVLRWDEPEGRCGALLRTNFFLTNVEPIHGEKDA